MEPPLKKQRIENAISVIIDEYINKIKRCDNLKAVLGDQFEKSLPTVKICVGHVKTPKELSNIINILNKKIPLKNLTHLKRVRNKEVLLCPTNFLNGSASIQEYLEHNVPEISNAFEYFKEMDVPSVAPKIKAQLKSLIWSFNFHPNKYYEQLVSDTFFSKEEMRTNITYMHIVLEAARWFLKDNLNSMDIPHNANVTVVIDPYIHTVVAISSYNNNHPLQHSAMLAIDNVAKTQCGGAWGPKTEDSNKCWLNGINSDLMQYLKLEFPQIRFGARVYKSKRDGEISNDEEKSDTGPYLCTGYYVYMLKEPCVMCSMALVHARAKRVFYCFDNLDSGGLKSKVKLQAIPSLNHHFEVFTGYL